MTVCHLKEKKQKKNPNKKFEAEPFLKIDDPARARRAI